MPGHYRLQVDWSNDGVFEDVTPELLAVSCERGRDSNSTLIGKSTAGRLHAVLRNTSNKYSPFNSSSSIFGNVLPGRKVRLIVGAETAGKSISYSGASGSYAAISDNAALSMGDIDMTIMSWTRLAAKSAADSHAIASKWTDGTIQEYLLDFGISADRFRWIVDDDGSGAVGSVNAATFGSPALNTWYLLLADHDAANNLIGISVNNGTRDTASHTGGIFNGTSEFRIGARNTTAYWLNGRVDTTAIWKRLLTAAEKTWLYNSGNGRCYAEIGKAGNDGSNLLTSLVAWWGMDAGSYWGLEALPGVDLHGSNNLIVLSAALADGVTKFDQVLWTGFLDYIEPEVSLSGQRIAHLYASGPLIKLAGENAKVSPPAQHAVRPGDIIDVILDDLDWPSTGRGINDGVVDIAHWYAESKEALSLMREMENTELGFLYEGRDWTICFQGRYYKDINSLTSQATFSDAAGATNPYNAIRETDPLREIFNYAEMTIQPYHEHSEATLWELEREVVVLQAGETRTLFASVIGQVDGESVAYVGEWTTFAVGIDGGASSSFALDPVNPTIQDLGDIVVTVTPFAKSLKIELENEGASSHQITLLEADGIPVALHNTYSVSSEDATSQTKFGRRTFPSSPWYPNTAYGQGAADYVVLRKKDPAALLSIEIPASRSAALLMQATRLDMSYRITLVANNSTGLGINQDFYIENIAHEINRGVEHRVLFELSPAIANPNWFILNSSLLNGSHKLAY